MDSSPGGAGLGLTWLGALVHGAVVDLVEELGPVVVHVDDVDVQVDGVLHLVAVHVHRVGPELQATQLVRAGATPSGDAPNRPPRGGRTEQLWTPKGWAGWACVGWERVMKLLWASVLSSAGKGEVVTCRNSGLTGGPEAGATGTPRPAWTSPCTLTTRCPSTYSARRKATGATLGFTPIPERSDLGQTQTLGVLNLYGAKVNSGVCHESTLLVFHSWAYLFLGHHEETERQPPALQRRGSGNSHGTIF